MGQTKEQRVIKEVVGKPTIQKFTPIATDMFLPNHSGIHHNLVADNITAQNATATQLFLNNSSVGTPSITIAHEGVINPAEKIKIYSDNPEELTITSTKTYMGAITPLADNTYKLGDAANRWEQGFFALGISDGTKTLDTPSNVGFSKWRFTDANVEVQGKIYVGASGAFLDINRYAGEGNTIWFGGTTSGDVDAIRIGSTYIGRTGIIYADNGLVNSSSSTNSSIKALTTGASISRSNTGTSPTLQVVNFAAQSGKDLQTWRYGYPETTIASVNDRGEWTGKSYTTSLGDFIAADNYGLKLGTGTDASFYFDATNLILTTAGDFKITCEANKTLELQTVVYDDLQFIVGAGKLPAANYPTYETFTTNTRAYAFSVDDYIYCDANEIPHWWKEGTLGDCHLHFTLKTAQNSGADRFAKFEVILAYADSNEVWVEQTMTGEKTIATGTAALTNLYVDLGNVTLTNYLIGTQITAKVKRIAATGGTEYADDVYITQTGIHLQKNTLGSRTETSK